MWPCGNSSAESQGTSHVFSPARLLRAAGAAQGVVWRPTSTLEACSPKGHMRVFSLTDWTLSEAPPGRREPGGAQGLNRLLFFFHGGWFSFQALLSQDTLSFVAENRSLSHSPRDQTSQSQGAGRVVLPVGAEGRVLASSSSRGLPAFLGSWPHHQSPPPSPSVCLRRLVCLSYGNLLLDSASTLIQDDIILKLITSTKTLFLNTVTLSGLER